MGCGARARAAATACGVGCNWVATAVQLWRALLRAIDATRCETMQQSPLMHAAAASRDSIKFATESCAGFVAKDGSKQKLLLEGSHTRSRR
jgi:hypothetical protein